VRIAATLGNWPERIPMEVALDDDAVFGMLVDYTKRSGVVTVNFDPERPVGRIEKVLRTAEGVLLEIELTEPVPLDVADLSPAVIERLGITGRSDYSIEGLSWIASPPLDKPGSS